MVSCSWPLPKGWEKHVDKEAHAYGDTWNTQGGVVTCWVHIKRNHTMTDTGMERKWEAPMEWWGGGERGIV